MIELGASYLSIQSFESLLREDAVIRLDKDALNKVQVNFEFLETFSENKVIYGINTGFGPMAQYTIRNGQQKQLQLNLIRGHCSGSGAPLPEECVKAIMLARLNTLMQGYSGVHPEAVELLTRLLNENILPVIYEHGGVGASGDLVQLAHLALGMTGEGEVWENGVIQPASEVFKRRDIQPLSIHIREGLAIMNGTSAMSGIGALNAILAKKLLLWSVAASALINELVRSFDDHFSMELNAVKRHPGQQAIAEMMRAMLSKSHLIRRRQDHLYNKKIEQSILKDKVQEYYSLRCVPQILGPVLDTIRGAEQVLVNEINSANDNPIIDHQNQDVYHGGNFHGDYVALEMDKLKTAITKLSILADRQLNYLLNEKLNGILPPFVNLGTPGFNFGMQGIQFAATSTVAENKALSYPVYLTSIPNNNDNQDVVSMGANAALMTRKVILNTFEVMAIEWLSLAQAVDYLNCQKELSPATRQLYDKVRQIIPAFSEDRPRHHELKQLQQFLIQHLPEIETGL